MRNSVYHRWGGRLRRCLPYLPVAVTTLVLSVVATQAVLEKTGGEPAVPLDDTFIHFQFARSWVDGHPLAYVPGAEPTPGATSLLWPLLLAPIVALGGHDVSLIWGAWLLGWLALGLLGHETWKLASRLCSREVSMAVAAMVLLFGGNVWFAGSGMELLPFAFLLMRTARRTAEWGEAHSQPAAGATPTRARAELCLLGVLAPLMRPEGVLATALAIAALALFPRGSSRAWALVPLAGPAILLGANLALTGQATTTTMQVKWLPESPYRNWLWPKVRGNLELLWGTLLDGRVWSSVFVPRGAKLATWPALPLLVLVGVRRKTVWRAAVVLVVALGIALPATYDTFLVNRLRYLWPFAGAWFVALGAVAEAVGEALSHVRSELLRTRLLVAGGFAGALASHLSDSIDDLATSADAIRRQQVSMARWANEALPADAVVGVNDAGAMAYFSNRRTFDVVGLTTASEGPYWVAGAGSRFEHYERLGASRLPTHFVVYETWFGIPGLLGEFLAERSVPGATILGGVTMAAFRARYSALGSGALPAPGVADGRALLDEVDVADLDSEASHGYTLFWATQQENVAVTGTGGRLDGGRQERTLDRFVATLAPHCLLVARLAASSPTRLAVRVGDSALGEWTLAGGWSWEELTLELVGDIPTNRQPLEVRSLDGRRFTSLHYWVFQKQK